MKSNESAVKHFSLAESYQQKGNFAQALENFNLCLCYAPAKSKLIFDSLTNRSKIYYKVKQYGRVLDNLNWAKEIKSMENGCTDLMEMLTTCKEEISRGTTAANATDFFQLTLPINERLPFVSACLELKQNEIYGRYFTTNKDLSPGDVIVAEEPFFKVVDSTVCHLRCCICCSTNLYSLIPCDNCSGAMFCSYECKSSSIHGRECEPAGKRMDTLEEYMLQRMFYQAMEVCGGSMDELKALVSSEAEHKTILDFDFRHCTDDVNKRKIILAVSGLDKRDPGSTETYSRYQKIIDRLSTETAATDDFLENYLVRCLQSLTVNFFHFFWSAVNEAKPKGFLLCALSAFFSHSCDPNVEKVDVDNRLVFVAKRPIKAGEQLNMCYDRYNYMRYSLDERQSYLNEVYKFKCNCDACANDYAKYNFTFDDHQLDVEKAKEKYRKNCEYIKQNMSTYPCQTICNVMEENVFLLSYIGNGMQF
ncbi:histone-lysine N-methyltransferase ASHR1-like [Bradysia coprophila]|uniref:histone-lysine N-methyltransferase ASHR1-like n=1 Tax=Bradysia coprophila TaxID=38358 RepID=UPI00187D76E5|nr:histone-lysine N-methyltransferase ASHR1-like [Bradysia coprophila]